MVIRFPVKALPTAVGPNRRTGRSKVSSVSRGGACTAQVVGGLIAVETGAAPWSALA